MRTHRTALARLSIALLVALTLAPLARGAEIRMPSVFGDHMVLQRGRPVPVWGTSSDVRSIEVEVAGVSARATPNAEGEWRVDLPPLAAGGPHAMRVTAGDETLVFEDVLVGEVWVCSGQSNMEWPLRDSDGGDAALAGAHDEGLRLMRVAKRSSPSSPYPTSERGMRSAAPSLTARIMTSTSSRRSSPR